jgi:hypothetical protein
VIYFATGPDAQVTVACIGVRSLDVNQPTKPFRKLCSVTTEATP